MLRIVTGPFHPYLETALADEIRQLKADDPFAAVAVIVPSSPLLDRVRYLLTVESDLCLLNVHFLTFHHLALRLWDEYRHASREAAASAFQLVDDLFFEQLIRRIVDSRLSALEPFRRLGHSAGTWAALWATVRDLKDAAVDSAEALRGVREGVFEEDEARGLEALFTLHAAVTEASRKLGVGTADDLAGAVVSCVHDSKFLGGLRHAVYYGFYDLTQVQLSLLEAVTTRVTTTLLFPLEDDPAFAFARRFFERYLQPLAPSADAVTPLPRSAGPFARPADDRLELQVMHTVGPEEEVAAACREILQLVETHGYRFDDIGVTARTLDPYLSCLQSVFDRHRIPFTSTAGRPLMHEPIVKVLLQLAALPVQGFYRTAMMDVLTSPLYRVERIGNGTEARPDLWKLAVETLNITRGEEEWRRLAGAGGASLAIGRDGESEEDGVGRPGIEATQLELLWRAVSGLIADCRALPARGSPARLTDAFFDLAARHLLLPGSTAEMEAGDPEAARWVAVGQALTAVAATLRQLDLLGGELSWEEWVRLFVRAIEETTIPIAGEDHRGVRVLDAMAARGLPFRALFILGLNEKMFPRSIREDAFLRDAHRRALAETLGFKIDEKLAGYDEEHLLFRLLCGAAGRRLYLIYQRTDDAGRALAPSAFIGAAGRWLGVESPLEVSVPRRLVERLERQPVIRSVLPPVEVALWLILQEQDPSAWLRAVGRDITLFLRGWEALEQLESGSQDLGPHDGLTGPLAAHWAVLEEQGVAPTALERYARCPFQYFAAQVLRLEPVRRPVRRDLDPQALGTLCHAALRRCYECLVGNEWPEKPLSASAVREVARTAVEAAFAECTAERAGGYALLWDMARETVAELVALCVEADQDEYRREGFKPAAFEVEGYGWLTGAAVGRRDAIPVKGRVDRVDRRDHPFALRVIDYKVKVGASMKSEDRNLLLSAVRGVRLQPPLYTLIEVPGHPPPSQVDFVFLAPKWERPLDRSTFPASAWNSSAGPQLRRTLATLIEGLAAGRFFILPNGYCDSCDYFGACRRFHEPTRWRAFRAEPAKVLRELRRQKLSDGDDG
ncbi:MAG TPA: PD-(D/E)XK nuclease family protein [Nitrospiraceae bacterium]|jgi:ATP-dependent helicase/nuclease subunit B|nr:PD-(D/E)XK nuclease family protein [Nitrospiraceae bacterium]